MSIDPRDRNCRTGANNDQHRNRKKNALPKLRNFKNIREGGDHRWRLFSDYNHRAPRLLDLLARSLTEFLGFDNQTLGQFTSSQDFHTVASAIDQPFVTQELLRNTRTGIEFFKIPDVNERKRSLERGVVETTLGQAPDQRHLAPFEPNSDAATRTRLLPLVPFAARLAVAGAFPASE